MQMDYDEFFSRLEKWEVETAEEKRRNAIYATLKCKPSVYKEALIKSAIDRIAWYFEYGRFGIISACEANNSKKKNFDLQLRLINKLKEQKLHGIPHIGFWDRIVSRAIFIPQIKKNHIRTLAKNMKLAVFIYGEKKNWKIYRTCNQDIIFKDDKLRLIDIDTDFLSYAKISAQKNRYLIIMDSIEKLSNTPHYHKTKKCLLIQNKINDLKRIEEELFP